MFTCAFPKGLFINMHVMLFDMYAQDINSHIMQLFKLSHPVEIRIWAVPWSSVTDNDMPWSIGLGARLLTMWHCNTTNLWEVWLSYWLIWMPNLTSLVIIITSSAGTVNIMRTMFGILWEEMPVFDRSKMTDCLFTFYNCMLCILKWVILCWREISSGHLSFLTLCKFNLNYIGACIWYGATQSHNVT